MHESYLADFKNDISSRLPGVLAYLNLADARRLNIHLGHETVDGVIEEITLCLADSTAPKGASKRVAGDIWLAFYKSPDLPRLGSFLSEMTKTDRITLGWRATAGKDGETRFAEKIVRTEFTISCRCVCMNLASIEDFDEQIEQLSAHYWKVDPGIPESLETAMASSEVRWCSVRAYPDEDPYCPFCNGRKFDWTDGDLTIYGASGDCKTCGADVDFRGVEIAD